MSIFDNLHVERRLDEDFKDTLDFPACMTRILRSNDLTPAAAFISIFVSPRVANMNLKLLTHQHQQVTEAGASPPGIATKAIIVHRLEIT